METKNIIKKIKSRNKTSNIYAFVSVLSGIGTTLTVVWLLDQFMRFQATENHIALAGILIALFQGCKAVFYAFGLSRAHNAAYRSLAEIRLELVSHLKKLPLGFFQKRKTGDLANIINHDVEQIEGYLAHTQPESASTIIVAVVTAATVFIIDWRLGLCLTLPVPVALLLLAVLMRLWNGMLKQYNQVTKEMSEDVMEYISVMPAIKAFSSDENKTDAVIRKVKSYVHAANRTMGGISASGGIVKMIFEAGLVLVLCLGLFMLFRNELSATKFTLAIILSGQFVVALNKYIYYEHAAIILGRSAENISSIIGEPVFEEQPSVSVTPGDIVFDNVTFAYDKRGNALENVSLIFKERTINAIVGASGSGKSTIAHLIMGFWKTNQGSITIGGMNLAVMNEKDLTSLISIVQQESFMFNTSIAENIRIGKPGAAISEIMEAAKKARIHEMIASLPDGYDTIVGESGAKLSGGEKQRIAIARVILKNAPIIILDEATAAIDPYNEHLIQIAISELSRDKTVIVIAHHLNTVTNADSIIVMQAGSVVDVGKHTELLASCPAYREMVEAQSEVDNWGIKEAKND